MLGSIHWDHSPEILNVGQLTDGFLERIKAVDCKSPPLATFEYQWRFLQWGFLDRERERERFFWRCESTVKHHLGGTFIMWHFECHLAKREKPDDCYRWLSDLLVRVDKEVPSCFYQRNVELGLNFPLLTRLFNCLFLLLFWVFFRFFCGSLVFPYFLFVFWLKSSHVYFWFHVRPFEPPPPILMVSIYSDGTFLCCTGFFWNLNFWRILNLQLRLFSGIFSVCAFVGLRIKKGKRKNGFLNGFFYFREGSQFPIGLFYIILLVRLWFPIPNWLINSWLIDSRLIGHLELSRSSLEGIQKFKHL